MTLNRMTRADEAYIEALRRIGNLADEHLDRPTADRIMLLIGGELARLGVTIASSHEPSGTVH